SSQNLRSAPQKQPMPNNAVSMPRGNGGCSRRPVMKWVPAVNTGLGLPSRASGAVGKELRLRNENMGRILRGPNPPPQKMGLTPQVYNRVLARPANVQRLE